MGDVHGDLLIGGIRLKHVQVEVQTDNVMPDSSEHLLAGRLSVDKCEKDLLETGRRYRLQIDDGRAGPVVVSRIDGEEHDGVEEVIVEFCPPPVDKPR